MDSEKTRVLSSLEEGAREAEEPRGAEEAAAVAAACSAPPAGEAPEEEECPVCYNPFDANHYAPRLLECLHTFCLPCLNQIQSADGEGSDAAEQGASISCPLCRHRTILPDGSLYNLIVKTRLTQTFQLQPHLLPLRASAHKHSLLQQSSVGATPAGASAVQQSSVGATPARISPVQQSSVGATPARISPVQQSSVGATPAGAYVVAVNPPSSNDCNCRSCICNCRSCICNCCGCICSCICNCCSCICSCICNCCSCICSCICNSCICRIVFIIAPLAGVVGLIIFLIYHLFNQGIISSVCIVAFCICCFVLRNCRGSQ